MRIYVLGCAGWMPGENQTSSILLEDGEELIMIDAGTGVKNLKEYGEVLERHNHMHLILSHYHLDHIIGLSYLSPFLKGMDLTIHGPGRPYYDETPQEILGHLFHGAFSSRKLHELAGSVTIEEYGEGRMEAGSLVFGLALQNHAGPSFSIVLKDRFAYLSDTTFMERDWGDAIIFHECWEIDTRMSTKHTSLLDMIEHMPPDVLQRTYLIHTNPFWEEHDKKRLMERVEGTGIQLAYDGMVLELE